MKKSMMDSHNDTYLEVSLAHVPTNIFTLVIVLTIYSIISRFTMNHFMLYNSGLEWWSWVMHG
jgi:hypothetical protein